MYDILIIGAGVTGGLIARRLAEYQLKICIVEKENDVAMGATKANSSIVHAGYDAMPGTLKAQLNVKGSEMMPQIAKELGVKYQNNGSLVIGFDERDREYIEELLKRGIQNGVRDLRIVEQEELRCLEPHISSRAICALYAPTGAIICPYQLAIAAVGNAMDNGVELKLNFEVDAIHSKGDYYEVRAGEEILKAGCIINAAGLYTDRIAEMVGDHSFQIHPRKGEYILLDKECGSLISHTVFRTPTKMGKGVLTTPTVDGNLLIGPTAVDIEEREDTVTTAEGYEYIVKCAAENLEAIPFGKTITSFSGLRAKGSTGDFVITSPKAGFINVAGIESPGLSASPAIAEYIVEMLSEQGISFEKKKTYNPYRKAQHAFFEADIEEKNEIIKRDSSFGKIVCRCESITQGEILEAIRTNPGARDLDGIKRRTRAQMGRCQGGFCSSQIVELLAKELDIPYEAVTKTGKGSYVNVGKTKG